MAIFKKNVLATLTPEELEKFNEVSFDILAISKMQDNLTDQMSGSLKKRKALWKEMSEKYNIEGSLQLDEETGEITQCRG